MAWLTKLAFIAIILPWLCQCMIQTVQTSPYRPSGNQTFYNRLPLFQVTDSQIFSINNNTIAIYDLTSGQISTFADDASCSEYDLSSENNMYCVTSNWHVLQLDPYDSKEQIVDYGVINLTGQFIIEASYYDGNILFTQNADQQIFNTSANQFTCQFYFDTSDPILPYEGGYIGINFSGYNGSLRYFSCNGTSLINFGNVGAAQFLLNSSSIIIVMINSNSNDLSALSIIQNKTGPVLNVENFYNFLKVNDTHFFMTSITDYDILDTLMLYTTNSDLEIIQCASIDVQNLGLSGFGSVFFFKGNNSVIIEYSDNTLFWVDLDSFTISQVSPIGSASYPQMLLSNGSMLGFTQDMYYIFSDNAFVTFGVFMNCYIDPSNADFVWMLLNNGSNVLMIQISTSISKTFPLDFSDNQNWTIVSASHEGADDYNFTLAMLEPGEFETPKIAVFISGIKQATISINGYNNMIFATNYQEGTLYYLSVSTSGISEEVYDFYNGYEINHSRVISGSLTNIAKINDNYAVMTNSTTSTEIFVYSFNESQFIYSQNFSVQMINQIVPLGINLTSYCIAQGFAILSVNGQTYSAFDTQGNQLDSITFPSTYNIRLQAISNISISLMVNTSSLNYLSVYQYTGTAPDPNPNPNPPNPNPQASPKLSLSHILLGVLIIASLMI